MGIPITLRQYPFLLILFYTCLLIVHVDVHTFIGHSFTDQGIIAFLLEFLLTGLCMCVCVYIILIFVCSCMEFHCCKVGGKIC